MKVYFAAPLFTTGERMFNAELGDRLRRAGHDVYLPQEQETDAGDPELSFRTDLEHLDGSSVVVGIMDGADPDSGTSWEIGYAFATKRPIILLRSDMRASNDTGAPYNLMLTQSATERIELTTPTVDEAAVAVLGALARLRARPRRRRDRPGACDSAGGCGPVCREPPTR